jgi:thiol:disulfide interchange protein DsbD
MHLHALTRFLFALLATLLTAGRTMAQDGVAVTATPQFTTVTPGQNFAVALRFSFTNNLHIWTNNPVVPDGVEGLVPEASKLKPPTGPLTTGVTVLIENAQWPKGSTVTVEPAGKPIQIIAYHEDTTVFVPVKIDATAPKGTATFNLVVHFQACDDKSCFQPDDREVPVTFEIGDVLVPGEASLFTTFDAKTGFAAAGGGAVQPAANATKPIVVDLGIFNWKLTISGFISYVLLMLLAVAGGFVLNLTPCVLPVIPLKILGLQNQAGSRGRMLFLGFVMFCGLVFFWLVIGGLLAFGLLSAVSRISSYWQFNIAIAIFMAVMGLGMFGAFTVGLPNWVYSIDAKHDSAKGSFLFGIMSAVLATPCVAPLAGGVMAGATLFSRPMALLIFLFIGVGMGLPYLVLAAFPKLVAWLPRAGPGSELLKQVLGMLMIVISFFFLGSALIILTASMPWIAKQLHWWAIAIGLAAAALWLAVRTWKITQSPVRRSVFTLAAAALAAAGFLWANTQTTNARRLALFWKDYQASTVDAALSQGEVVVMDFTAEWCLICKTLESSVLTASDVEDQLAGAKSFRVDLTDNAAPGWQRLASLGQKGVPALAIMGPGLKEPWVRNAYTTTEVIEAIKQAGGGKAPKQTNAAKP